MAENHNSGIITITDKSIPTIVSYDLDKKKFVIGDNARLIGLKGESNIFNFKIDLGDTDKKFSQDKKYWTYVEDEKGDHQTQTHTAKEVTISFLQELLKDIDLPEQIIIGEPAVRDKKWKEYFRNHMTEIIKEIGFSNPPQFFPEPFAVFQYYSHYENIFLKTDLQENVLVIDIGAGTFNCCIIRTTKEGSLSRGGATKLPLGLQAEKLGGAYLDNEILKIIVQRAKNQGVKWKDNPLERIKASTIPVLLHVEDLKISLSDKIKPTNRLTEDFSEIKERTRIPKGTLHPEQDISVEITGNDLKKVIRGVWRNNWGEILIKCVNEASEQIKKIGGELKKIDKVIIAGGSSNLPFMKEEIALVLPTYTKSQNIHIGSDPGNAVAFGIACECKEQSSRNSALSIGRIAPCLLDDLYLAFKKEKRGKYTIPKVKFNEETNHNGMLVSSPFETGNLKLSYEIELPFEARDKIYYYFSKQPFNEDYVDSPLNINDNVFDVKELNKIARKITLDLEIKENGAVFPTFLLKEKGSGARKEPRKFSCNEFFIEDFIFPNGQPYFGLDFGTSNSYLVKLLYNNKAETNNATEYPTFNIDKSSLEQLRKLELEIRSFKETNDITKEKIQSFAKRNKLLMVFHSNKIEGNPLTKGETEELLFKDNPENPTKKDIEAINLSNAFDWVLDNYMALSSEPEGFIREVNKKILSGIDIEGGEYRKSPVKLSGMEFTPPPSSTVPAFMKKLGDEIKKGANERSALEFATTIHTKFVYIHPFKDGNGRTARLILSAILWSYNLPGIIVNYIEKPRYLDALDVSNSGNISTIIEFFLENFQDQLDNFIKEITEHDQTNKIIAIDEGEKGKKLSISTDDLIGKIMRKKILVLQNEREKQYQEWSKLFLSFRSKFIHIIDEFNKKYSNRGFLIKKYEYDILDLEKYFDLQSMERHSKTWFFAFDIIVNSSGFTYSREKFLFLFQYSPSLSNLDTVHKISLILFRDLNERFKPLRNEPINIREIFIKDGKLHFFDSSYNDNLLENNTIEKIIAEIIEEFVL